MKQKHSITDNSRTNSKVIVLLIFVVVIISVVAGVAIYRTMVAPFNTVVIEVNDAKITMRYFLKRAAMSKEPPIQMLRTLTMEQMIKQSAENPPFNISITNDDVEWFVREIAMGSDTDINENEFQEWYRQQLNETQLSDAEYRDLHRTKLLGLKMEASLSQRIPTVAAQVFVNMISVADIRKAEWVKEKYEAGVDFPTLARKFSARPVLAEAGGKLGWLPAGILDSRLDAIAFELEIGHISNPVFLDEENVVLIMVSDKTDSRQIDDHSLRILRSKVLDNWYDEAYKSFEVQLHGFDNGYDSETDSWVRWQIERMQHRKPQNE